MAITLNKLQALDQYANVEDFSEVFDIYTFPLIEYNNTPKIGAGIAGYSVYRNSANRELAVLFLLDVISAAGQSAMSDAGINLSFHPARICRYRSTGLPAYCGL